MTTVNLFVNPMGSNGFNELRDELNLFVHNNFEQLYAGAVRLDCHIPSDYYAPNRIQINNTRLHMQTGLKIADGHRYDVDDIISEDQLRNTIADIQELLNAAARTIPAPFQLKIIE